ncbi:MAG: hypothetical protein K6A62_04605 [Bacteroidales bacterium]|nr:hypothetical protein [Bacteroidales bacterium]
MNREEKDLLRKDLCGRLPYGVIVHFEGWASEKLLEINLQIDVFNSMGGLPIPYLRPMSSMTEEEIAEYQYITERWMYDASYSIGDSIDWLNANHFDYRGLIEKGLAIAVTEENNPYNKAIWTGKN